MAAAPVAPGDLVALVDHRTREVARVVFWEENALRVALETPAAARALGREVTVDAACVRGLLRATGFVRERRERELAVALDAAPELVQRREHVRASAELPVVVESLDMPGATAGRTIDAGGGGARLELPRHELSRDDLVRIELELPDGEPVEASARVVRVYGDDVSVEFRGIAWGERERLIRFVFARLRSGARIW
jgi:PilZ domain